MSPTGDPLRAGRIESRPSETASHVWLFGRGFPFDHLVLDLYPNLISMSLFRPLSRSVSTQVMTKIETRIMTDEDRDKDQDEDSVGPFGSTRLLDGVLQKSGFHG